MPINEEPLVTYDTSSNILIRIRFRIAIYNSNTVNDLEDEQ